MWNTDAGYRARQATPIYSSIPFYVAVNAGRAYGVFFDDSYKSEFDFGARLRNNVGFTADGGELRYYVFPGPSVGDGARRVHPAHRPHAAPARVGARLPAEPLGLLPGQRAVPDHPRVPQPRHPVRRAVPRHRLHGRVPPLHLEPAALPRPAPDAGGPAAPGHEGHDHRGRRRQGGQRLRRVPPAPGRERLRDVARRVAVRGRRVARQDHLPRLQPCRPDADLVGRDGQPAVGRRASRASGTT